MEFHNGVTPAKEARAKIRLQLFTYEIHITFHVLNRRLSCGRSSIEGHEIGGCLRLIRIKKFPDNKIGGAIKLEIWAARTYSCIKFFRK
jgi:hypothetical protein